MAYLAGYHDGQRVLREARREAQREADAWAIRAIYRPALERARRKLAENDMPPGMRDYFQREADRAQAEIRKFEGA